MSTNVSYIKGVRTRYVNILKKETKLGEDLGLSDENDIIVKCNSCIERLQLYCDKVEIQTEKLAEAIGDSDKDLTEQLVSENASICDKAIDCVTNLKQFKDEISMAKEKKAATKEKYGLDQIVYLQKQMNSIVTNQMKNQAEFIEKQELKEKEMAMAVKLPKLEMTSYSGDKFKWTEFWDAFENAVHNNKKLSNIEKFNYLKSKLNGEAHRAVLGLTLSNENYEVAIGILKERFGNTQEVIDLHYNQMINLFPATNTTASLRGLLDKMETHLRSLEVLKQDVNQDVFVSMIRAKLPEDVLLQLEMLNGASNKWTVGSLRSRLNEYITAREHSEKKSSSSESSHKKNIPPQNGNRNRSGHNGNTYRSFSPKHLNKKTSSLFQQTPQTSPKSNISSAEALVVNAKQSSTTRFYDQCRYCSERHWSDECSNYSTLEERKKRLRDSCFKCLKVGHMSKECKKNKTCVYCGEINSHHRSLCPQKFKTKTSGAHLTGEVSAMCGGGACAMSGDGMCAISNGGVCSVSSGDASVQNESVLISSGEIVLMQTAKTEVKNPCTNKSDVVRILLDSGSQRTYVTEKLAEQLHLTKDKEEEIKLVTFGSEKPKSVKTFQTKISLKLKNGQYLDIGANIVPVISGTVQRNAMKLCTSENMQHLVSSLDMADSIPTESESSSIELLIGNDYYLDILLSQKIEIQPGLYLLASKLGWILTGRTSEINSETEVTSMLSILTYGNNITKSCVFTNVDRVNERKPDLEDFWNVESIGVLDNPNSTNDEIAKENFKQTVRFEEGRYQVTWPWKDSDPDLPLNRELALGRLRSNVKRMKDKPELINTYDKIIQDQLEKGVIEKVDETVADGPRHYLPHHAVINPLKPTTKLRIVYDASAKSRKDNKSLNESLYRGPVLLNDLCGLLLRFRLNTVAIVADIEKAFLQIGLQPSERDVTRFLWLKDTSRVNVDSDNIQTYRFCRVPFGVISSPFLLGATIESHLENYDSEIAMKLKDDIYVDNLITGTSTPADAIHLYREAKTIFKEASMNLREWTSNNAQVNQFIAKEDLAICESVKVLGHTWAIEKDLISVKKTSKQPEHKPYTKRNVLKEVASVFDPLGLFSPVLLKGKVFLQTLWDRHLDWDDEIDSEDKTLWSKISSEVSKLSECAIKRCIALCESKENVSYHLLCFCDASASAYAAVVYLHQVSEDMDSRCDLIFSKTRLAPLKTLTIPRLELMAVLIGVRCLTFVKNQLKLPIKGIHLWTDSQCVLQWINSEKDLTVFVRNRVKEIKSNNDIVFGFVPSNENPADIASRGTTVQNLSENNLWWHGPKWLCERENNWPMSVTEDVDEKTKLDYESELKKQRNQKEIQSFSMSENVTESSAMHYNGKCTPFGIDSERFSTLTKLLRVTAYVLRFVRRLQRSVRDKGNNVTKNDESCYLTSADIVAAEHMWIMQTQRKHFQEVFTSIEGKRTNNLQRQLGIYPDDTGILRCKGRIEHANLSEGAKNPILLPKNDQFTKLIIESIHKQQLHSGTSQTLGYIRHRFWIPQGRAIVRSVLMQCRTCRRHEGGPYKMPMMPPLPRSRVREAQAFSRTGLDYLGPLNIKTGEGTNKSWVCLFTCLVTRAIHLELMKDMTAEEFLLGFRRFISVRGTPVEIISDNALQFKSASKVLESAWRQLTKCEDVQSYVSNSGIKWSFIVELAPWMGGFYERLVGLVKRALRKSLGKRLLFENQLQTVLKEIEAVVNSRPLVYVGDDIDANITLTPGHFLTMNPKTGVAESESDTNDPDFNPYESSTERLLETWKKGQKLLNAFWRIWRDEYLLSLRERSQRKLKSGRKQSNYSPSIGDVVLIKENTPRGCWKLGKIIELVTSRDQCTRSAKVSLSSGRIIGRPLNLLFPIEVSSENDENSGSCDTRQGVSSNEEVAIRPTRVAAQHAKLKIKQCLN